MLKPKQKFCASPWIEGVFRLNGAFQPCCKMNAPYGNWKQSGLAQPWHSEAAVLVRKQIIEGHFPNTDCESCHNNRQSTSLKELLAGPLTSFLRRLARQNPEPPQGLLKTLRLSRIRRRLLRLERISKVRHLMQIRAIFNADKRQLDTESSSILNTVYGALTALNSKANKYPAEYADLVHRIRNIAEITEDFLNGELYPRHIAPFRQANLIAVCNARCIQCPGLYTGEISEGMKMSDGTLFKEMGREEIDRTLESESSIIDFFANGSELLFHKDWRYIADRLRENSVKLRVSTNGMLLTKKNVTYLVDNDIARKMNISLDAASPELLEEIRVRVKFDRVCRNIEFLVHYCEEQKFSLDLSFSFCLMKRNYHELPEYMKLVEKLTGITNYVQVNIMVQPMALKGGDEYRDFVEEEHHTLINEEALRNKFKEMLKNSRDFDIPVQVFYNYSLEDFVKKDCPLPELQWSLASGQD